MISSAGDSSSFTVPWRRHSKGRPAQASDENGDWAWHRIQRQSGCRCNRRRHSDDSLILIGTPTNNALLAKMADNLPLKWTATGLSLGSVTVDVLARACIIVRTVVAHALRRSCDRDDDAGYQCGAPEIPA